MVIVCITIILVFPMVIVSHKTEENNCNSYNSHGKTKIIVILTIPMGKHMIIVMFTIPMEKTKISMILSISMDHNYSVSQFVNHICMYPYLEQEWAKKPWSKWNSGSWFFPWNCKQHNDHGLSHGNCKNRNDLGFSMGIVGNRDGTYTSLEQKF